MLTCILLTNPCGQLLHPPNLTRYFVTVKYFKREAAIDVLLSPLTSFILVSRMNDLFIQSTHLQYIQILMSFALGCLQLCSLESTTLQLTLPNLFINLYNIDFEVLPVYGPP